MSVDENRNMSYCDESIEPITDCCLKDKMIQEIRCHEFAITDLALYLDTHPDDEKALCLHIKYCKDLRELEDKYQKMFGPLTIKCPCNKWRWIENPWPWEGGMN